MNFIVVLTLFSFVTPMLGSLPNRDPCKISFDCNKLTETSAYRNCMQTRRIKRQICPYENSIQPQVVQAIPAGIQPVFQNIQPIETVCNGGSCAQIQPQPCLGNGCSPTVVTSQNCINSCTQTCGGAACDDRCQNSCQPSLPNQNTTSIIQKEIRESSASSPNVTTIIKLTNIVNNTNVVNVPTNINNTNINNLDMSSNSTSRESPQKCCLVVQPKVCSKLNSTEGGYRCIHRKHHTCGEPCVAATVHAQVRQPCVGPPSECPPQIAYVPQPQPACSYQPTWPYVNCGGQNQKAECGGCYDHYGYGYHNFYGNSPPSCNGCYDDGLKPGSSYRQGPVYQPGYYHAPPVYNQPIQMPMQPNCGGYGCFGNQYVDPVFGYPSYSPYSTGNIYPQFQNSAVQPQQNFGQSQQYFGQPQQFFGQQQQYFGQPHQYYDFPQTHNPEYLSNYFNFESTNVTSNATMENEKQNSTSVNRTESSVQIPAVQYPWGQQSPQIYPYPMAPPMAPSYYPPVYQSPVYQPQIYQPQIYQPQIYQPPVYQPPVYQPPFFASPAVQPSFSYQNPYPYPWNYQMGPISHIIPYDAAENNMNNMNVTGVIVNS